MPPISSLSSILPLIDTSAPCSRDNRENGSYGSAGMSEVMAARCFTTADAPFCEDSRVGMRTCLGMLDVALGLQWIARLILYAGLHCGLFVIFNTGKTLSPDRIFFDDRKISSGYYYYLQRTYKISSIFLVSLHLYPRSRVVDSRPPS